MSERTLILGGEVIDQSGRRRADVAIADGRIVAVGAGLSPAESDHVLDATGCVVSPGFVDLHTHLREPGKEEAETIETGSRAAALGGFTAVVAMPNTDPGAEKPNDPMGGMPQAGSKPDAGDAKPDKAPQPAGAKPAPKEQMGKTEFLTLFTTQLIGPTLAMARGRSSRLACSSARSASRVMACLPNCRISSAVACASVGEDR